MPSQTLLPQPITGDRGILKLLKRQGDPCKTFPKYHLAAKAVFHYKIFTIPFKNKCDPDDLFKGGQALISLADNFSSMADVDDEHFHPKKIDTQCRTKIGDSLNWDKKPFELRLNKGFSVQAFELAVRTMRIGERSVFYCTAPYSEPYIQLESILRRQRLNDHSSHGCCGKGFDFDANQDLFQLYGCPVEMHLELIDVVDNQEFDLLTLSSTRKIEVAITEKTEADGYFKRGNYSKAAELYGHSIGVLQSVFNSENEVSVDLAFVKQNIRLYKLNYCACKLKTGDYKEVITHTTVILNEEPSNIKARYRRAKAYLFIDDLDMALKDYQKVQSQPLDESTLKQISIDLQVIEQKRTNAKKKEAKIYKNIFSHGALEKGRQE